MSRRIKQTAHEVQHDRQREESTMRMVVDPNEWPMWPFLPVKQARHTLQDRELGYLFADGKGLVVRQGNVFSPNVETDPVLGTYETAADLVSAGWVVD